MNTNIRDGVFETNSSSSHSLTMAPGEIADFAIDRQALRDGKITVRLGGFGTSYHRYYLPSNKLAYLLAYMTDASYLEEIPSGNYNVAFALRRHSDWIDRLVTKVERLTGCVLEVIPERPYLDSQARETGVADHLVRDIDAMVALVFSPDSMVQTGSDEYYAGEFIPTDRGAPEPAYPLQVAEKVEGDVRFRMEFPPLDEDIVILDDGTREIVAEAPRRAGAIMDACDGVFLTRVHVGDGDSVPADQPTRDAVFRFLARVNSDGPPRRLPLAPDVEITGKADEMDSEHDLRFRTECVATRQAFDHLGKTMAANTPQTGHRP
jgi:hypothetical protein